MKTVQCLILSGVIALGIPFTTFAQWHGGHHYGGYGYHSYGGYGYHPYGGYGYRSYSGSGFYGRNAVQRNLRAIHRDQYLVNFANERQAGILRDDIDRRVHFLRNNFGVEVP